MQCTEAVSSTEAAPDEELDHSYAVEVTITSAQRMALRAIGHRLLDGGLEQYAADVALVLANVKRGVSKDERSELFGAFPTLERLVSIAYLTRFSDRDETLAVVSLAGALADALDRKASAEGGEGS